MTAAGLTCAYGIPIEAIQPFVTVVIILLIVAALSALLLLPAIYSFMVTSNLGLTGGMSAMVKSSGLNLSKKTNDSTITESQQHMVTQMTLGKHPVL